MNSPSLSATRSGSSSTSSGGGRRGSFSETKYIYNKSRTGFYPAKITRQQRSLTFNETFRALFPAVFAVFLSLFVLSAFNQLHGNKVLEWINENAISLPGYSIIQQTPSQISKNQQYVQYGPLNENQQSLLMSSIDGFRLPPFNLEEYEKLGSKTSGSYWSNKARGEEYKQKMLKQQSNNNNNRNLNIKSMINPKYQSYGPFASSSYYENIGKMEEYQEKKLMNQFN